MILQGAGENGKSALTTDGLVPALGSYASMASSKLFQSTKGSEDSTEMADRGRRLLIAEELTEGRSIDVAALKRISDVGTIKARYIRRDNMEFKSTHSLMVTTNYIPVINETDRGAWRRLLLLRFPYTFRKANEKLLTDNDRYGDTQLKPRIKAKRSGQWDAIVTWAIDGAIQYYAWERGNPELAFQPTVRIQEGTEAWRAQADRVLGFWREERSTTLTGP